MSDAQQEHSEGFTTGLRAARVAVIAEWEKDGPTVQGQTRWGVDLALAAIDGLIGGKR